MCYLLLDFVLITAYFGNDDVDIPEFDKECTINSSTGRGRLWGTGFGTIIDFTKFHKLSTLIRENEFHNSLNAQGGLISLADRYVVRMEHVFVVVVFRLCLDIHFKY